MRKFLFILFLLSLPTGCAVPYGSVENLRVEPVSREEAGSLAGGLSPLAQELEDWNGLAFGLRQSLSYLETRPADFSLTLPGKAGLRLGREDLRAALLRLQEILPYLDVNPGLLAEEFRWLRLVPDFGFTGYYEPVLPADYQAGPLFSHPLYALPPEVKPGVRYYDRRAIDREMALAGRGLEIAWLRDETDVFFLHVQGSGRLVFPDGKSRHVLYAGRNGHPYVSLGKVMRDRGLLAPDQVNMPGIRAALRENPHLAEELLDSNPAYVFFRLEDEGPVGAMGRRLTPRVSLAVDPGVLPYGALLFFQTRLPDESGALTRGIQALGLPQDRGSAIKGRRIDWFLGPGREAAHLAGYLNAPGQVYILLPVEGGSFTRNFRQGGVGLQ